MSQEESSRIMSLPDEVLCHIFSFVTMIPAKLNLESVCQRFRRISTTQQSSWLGSDALAININCYNKLIEKPTIRYFGDCCKSCAPYSPTHLNGCNMPLEKWPAAIAQLLERTIIRKLCIHIDDPQQDFLTTNILETFSVIQNNLSRIKLNYLEFHRRAGFSEGGEDAISDRMFFWASQHSQNTLQKVVLVLESPDSVSDQNEFRNRNFAPIFAAIKKCTKLKSFVIQPTELLPFIQVVDALEGKPLTNLITITGDRSVFQNRETDQNHMEQSILAVCATSSCGIKSLNVTSKSKRTMTNLTAFSESLDDRCKGSLEHISIRNLSPGAPINSYLSHLDQLPFLFPNLKYLQFEFPQSGIVLDESLLLNTKFFENCSQTATVNGYVLVSYVPVDDINQFKERLTASCEANGIRADFDRDESWVIMKKYNGIIELRNVHEEEELETESDEDVDSGDDQWDMEDDLIDDEEEEEEEQMEMELDHCLIALAGGGNSN